MVNIPRIHCHSAFKHYEMFHCNQSSGYGNSVFNTTYNFNGGSMCGGGFWGGLLGGFGMGLGASLMNFLGGGMGMFGGGMGMFGGFSPFGMFGGGGFSPMTSWFSPRRTQTDGAGGREQETKEKIVEKENKDTKILGKYSEQVKNLNEQTTPIDKQKLKDLYAQIVKSKNEHDDIEEDSDTKIYDNLLNDLKQIGEKNGLEVKDDALVEKAPAVESPVVEPPQDNDETADVDGNDAVDETADVDDSQPVTEDLTKKDITQLTDEQVIAMSRDEALAVLEHNSRITQNGDEKYVKVPRNYKELVLAKKSGLKIQFCKNLESVGKNKKSSTIQGNVLGDITENEGKYSIKIQDKYGKYTLEFDFNTKTVEVTESEGAKIKYTDDNGNEQEVSLNNKRSGSNYKYQINDDWAERRGESLLFI